MNDDHSFQPDLGTIEQNPVENEEVRTAEEDKPAKEVTIADSSGGDKTFECQNCHTIFRASNPGETHCVYCGMQGLTVVEGQSFEGYQVLPFLETLNDAFSGYTKKTFFNPITFSK